MAAAAHNPEFAKKVGISQDVAKEFNQADKGKKFGSSNRADLQKINRKTTRHGQMALFKEGGPMKDKLKSMFKGKETYAEELKEAKAIKSGKITPQEYARGEKMEGHKKGGCVKKMAKGGVTRADGCISKGHTKGKMV